MYVRRATATSALIGMGLFAAGLVTLLHRLGGMAVAARVAEQWWPALILLLIAHRACTFLIKPPAVVRMWMIGP